jgi:hypothetical protein
MRTHCDATSAVGDGKPSPALSRYLMPQPGTTDAAYLLAAVGGQQASVMASRPWCRSGRRHGGDRGRLPSGSPHPPERSPVAGASNSSWTSQVPWPTTFRKAWHSSTTSAFELARIRA